MPAPYGWGLSPWGTGPWGAALPAGAPLVGGVVTPAGSGLVDILGGDVIKVIGMGFSAPMKVEVLSGVGPLYVVEGEAYVFDPRYDVGATFIFAGSPKLPQGIYHVRVTRLEDMTTAVIENALQYEPFAAQLKVERVRVGLARVWANGRRLLRGT